MNYGDKYKDPRWQKKRLEIMNRDGFACSICSNTANKLNVHHLYYYPKRQPWEYPNGALVTLCDDCHESQHLDAEDDPPLVDMIFERWYGYAAFMNICEGLPIFSRCKEGDKTDFLGMLLMDYAYYHEDIGELIEFLDKDRDKNRYRRHEEKGTV